MSTFVGGMCSIGCHMALVSAFMHLYSVYFICDSAKDEINVPICDCFCPFLFIIVLMWYSPVQEKKKDGRVIPHMSLDKHADGHTHSGLWRVNSR